MPIKPMYNLFLDDIRTPDMVFTNWQEYDLKIVRSYDAFVNCILENGLPKFISFDNDLGLDENGEIAPDGYACVKWLIYESGLDLINLKFNVHSANPVAAGQIRGLLTNYIYHLRRERNIPETFSNGMNFETIRSVIQIEGESDATIVDFIFIVSKSEEDQIWLNDRVNAELDKIANNRKYVIMSSVGIYEPISDDLIINRKEMPYNTRALIAKVINDGN